MVGANQGYFSFQGVGATESISFVDQSGVVPASGTMRIYVAGGLPAQDSDLTFYYNGSAVTTIKNCHIDSVDFESNSGGQIASIRFVDERWTWDKCKIDGKYNFPLPNNWIDPGHEATPQQLATWCFQAMGVSLFDVSQLPNDSRPEVDWVAANPAQELEKLCSDLGCRIVPQRSTGAWVIWSTGNGNKLPDNYPYEDWGQQINPKEVPDYVRIVSGPWRCQIFLPIAARGKDLDLSWKPIQQLSYAPSPTMKSAGFYRDPWEFRFLASQEVTRPDGTTAGGTVRYTLPDGTSISPQELANDTVFKCWAVDFTNQQGAFQRGGNWFMSFPGIPFPVTVQQLILSDKLVSTYTDALGVQHERPAFVSGSFFGRLAENGNYPLGTRIDKQWDRSDQNHDERASFSLSLDPIDTTRSIISISRPMVYQVNSTGENYIPASLQYCCAVNVRDPNTWQPIRYEYLYQIGSGTNPAFCKTIVKNDIQPWTVQNNSVRFGPPYSSNLSEVQKQCLYYAQSAAREFVATASGKRTYIGIYPIDMDGQIQQVSYSIDAGGTSMRVSMGTEHSWFTPDAEERRRQIARQGIAERLDFLKYELQRREALKGRYNT